MEVLDKYVWPESDSRWRCLWQASVCSFLLAFVYLLLFWLVCLGLSASGPYPTSSAFDA